MGSEQKLLPGNVIEPPPLNADEADQLRDQLRRVTSERDAIARENVRLRQRINQIDGPAGALKAQLGPLYQTLRALFGDIELIDPESQRNVGVTVESDLKPGGIHADQDARVHAVWERWKADVGPKCAKVIDVLLDRPGLNQTQLAIAVGCRRQRVSDYIFKLNKLGLIDKSGGRFSLKQL